MSVPNHSLVNWPTESGFFTPSNTLSHYFMLKEKFQTLEHQLKRLEQVPSAKFKDPYHKKTNNLELQLYMLKATLESIRTLLQDYSKKITIETNFTFRLAKCEKRANIIFSKVDFGCGIKPRRQQTRIQFKANHQIK